MDTKDTTTQNLLFLLMAAPIGVGGCVISSSDDDAGNATENATTTGNATDAVTDDDGTTAGNATDNATTEVATTEATTAATGGDTTVGEATTTSDDSTGAPPVSVCQAYADIITECYSEKEGQGVLDYCPEYLEMLYDSYGEGCVTVYEDYLACLSMLTCKEFMGDACPDEQAALDTACAAA